MITAGEVYFIKEVIRDLCALADPSEYYEGEVDEALNLLDKLLSHDTQQISDIINYMNNQLRQQSAVLNKELN